MKAAVGLLGLAAGLVAGQFPVTPKDVKVLDSKFGDGVKITYKQNSLCEEQSGSYSGYVHLPPGTLEDLDEEQNYSINTFFWFFEARNDPHNAPLSIWMNGGPGSSSVLGLLVEHGPCYVNPDSNSTTNNPFAFNENVNMLFLDQPVQVGLSYDSLQNVTVDLISGSVDKLNATTPVPEQNSTLLVGTYPSQEANNTAFGSRNGAIALWHFAQAWFQEFPIYSPNDSRISIATESYGGRYGPAYAAFFEEQNQKIENGTWVDNDGEMYILNLDTLMIINGCVDRQVQYPAYAHMAYNNTYGIEAVNETIYNQMQEAYYGEGGCRDRINDCRALAIEYDPENRGLNATVNDVCEDAETFCATSLRDPYIDYSGRNYYDISTGDINGLPPSWYQGYLNQPWVQQELGVPLNWTQSSSTVSRAFRGIGDYPRPGWLEDLSYLLENGIKVALVYGDRDYACNWIGGEAVSLAINWTNTAEYHASGYEEIVVNDTYVGGLVRQYGNLSFTRVFQAGHEVPYYQPETALKIFERALFNFDIATGKSDTAANSSYHTEGPADTWGYRQAPNPEPLRICYSLDPGSTCSEDQIEAIENGTAVLVDWILKDENSTSLYPDIFS